MFALVFSRLCTLKTVYASSHIVVNSYIRMVSAHLYVVWIIQTASTLIWTFSNVRWVCWWITTFMIYLQKLEYQWVPANNLSYVLRFSHNYKISKLYFQEFCVLSILKFSYSTLFTETITRYYKTRIYLHVQKVRVIHVLKCAYKRLKMRLYRVWNARI